MVDRISHSLSLQIAVLLSDVPSKNDVDSETD